MIRIEEISKKYGNHSVLKGISYKFEKGKIYGIIGENGAGKSTLIKCILGLEECEGAIAMPEEYSCGYLPDTLYFYPYITGREFIDFCLKAKGQMIDEEEIAYQNEIFKLPLDTYCTRYSLGMKKRLALLCLVLQKCSIYILDEPCNGLDLLGVVYFKQWCRQQREKGATIIVTSHLISSLSEYCNRILYIHEGRLIKDYSVQEFHTIEADILNHSSMLLGDKKVSDKTETTIQKVVASLQL